MGRLCRNRKLTMVNIKTTRRLPILNPIRAALPARVLFLPHFTETKRRAARKKMAEILIASVLRLMLPNCWITAGGIAGTIGGIPFNPRNVGIWTSMRFSAIAVTTPRLIEMGIRSNRNPSPSTPNSRNHIPTQNVNAGSIMKGGIRAAAAKGPII